MKTKEMFKCLGYSLVTNDTKTIRYMKVITDYALIDKEEESCNTWEKCSYKHYISFDLKQKEVDLYAHNYCDCTDEYPFSINIFEMKAIMKQCNDLGWLDETN